MRFSFKKTLATILSIALILSSFVAAFSSSAAEASVVGALSLEDVSATLDDNNQFSAVANISLEQPSSYLHVAFTLADLPQGVSLVAVSADTLAATIVNLDNGIDAIYLEGDKAAVSNVAITFTFTADDDVDFTLAVNKIFAMDDSELDVNINVSDSAFVSVKKQQSGEPEEPCKHVWVYDESKPAKPATDKEVGSINLVCSACGEKTTKEVGYGKGYKAEFNSAVYKSEVIMTFNTRKTIVNRLGTAQNAILVVEKEMHNGDGNKIYVKDLPDTTSANVTIGGNTYDCVRWTIGLPAKEYTDNMTATLYLNFDGVWYNGVQSTVSMASYCQSIIGTVKADERNLIAKVLNYGAKAQAFFDNYNIEDLATDYLGEYSSLIDESVPALEDNSFNTYDRTKITAFVEQVSLVCKSKVLIHYQIRTVSTADVSTMEITAQAEGKEPIVYTAADEATTEQIDKNEFYYGPHATLANRYHFYFADLAAKDMRKQVSVTTKNAAGDMSITSLHSIEDIIWKLINETGIGEKETAMYYAMLHYGDAAATMFS